MKLQRRDLFRATVAGFLSKFVGTALATKTVDAVYLAVDTMNGSELLHFNSSTDRIVLSEDSTDYAPLVGPFLDV